MENRPDLIARIERPLLGNGADVLRAVRSPAKWAACLRDAGLPSPAIANAPTAGRWLLKPRKSAAGFGIAPYDGRSFNPRTHYLQEWIDGVPCSGIFLGSRLLGITRQLIGTPWLNAQHWSVAVGR
jgi:predicted ATP-grasp superfamily ATP-dependent carboligase